jgi:RNA polymerase sigma factor (sigma-70 family)
VSQSEQADPVVAEALSRLRDGQVSAWEDLLRLAREPMRRLVERLMARDFARVRGWQDTDDVAQNAVIRLARALRHIRPESVRDFRALAAAMVRRELLDIARRRFGRFGSGVHRAELPRDGDSGEYALPDLACEDPATLAAWTDFHHAADALPAEEREVFGLLWYRGMQQAEAAALLGVSPATVKRRWHSARLKLIGRCLP